MIYLNVYNEQQGRVYNEIAKHITTPYIFHVERNPHAAYYITVPHRVGSLVSPVADERVLKKGDIIMTSLHSRYVTLQEIINKGVRLCVISEDIVHQDKGKQIYFPLGRERTSVTCEVFVSGNLELMYAGFKECPSNWHIVGNPRYDWAASIVRKPKKKGIVFATLTPAFRESFPKFSDKQVEDKYFDFWCDVSGEFTKNYNMSIKSHPRERFFSQRIDNIFKKIPQKIERVGRLVPAESLLADVEFAIVGASVSTSLICISANVPVLLFNYGGVARKLFPSNWFWEDNTSIEKFLDSKEQIFAEQQTWRAENIRIGGSAKTVAEYLMRWDNE